MTNALPLFYYSSTWIYVDDDKTLLKCMALVLDEHNNVKTFQSPNQCIDFLNNTQSPLSKYSFLKSITSDETYGVLQHTPIDFDITKIASLAYDANRHNEITAMVIDYNMPEMNGFSLAQACHHLPIQKILLTGKAQEGEAINGFNNNLIHRFIQKGEIAMEEKLICYLKELSFQYFQKISAPLLSYLETENRLPLSDPVFIKFFENYCNERNIVEYYLIDKQGSFLCIDDAGSESCLVIHSDRSIISWLTLYGKDHQLANEDFKALNEKRKIPFFGIAKEASHLEPSDWSNHLYAPNILEAGERYYWVSTNL